MLYWKILHSILTVFRHNLLSLEATSAKSTKKECGKILTHNLFNFLNLKDVLYPFDEDSDVDHIILLAEGFLDQFEST